MRRSRAVTVAVAGLVGAGVIAGSLIVSDGIGKGNRRVAVPVVRGGPPPAAPTTTATPTPPSTAPAATTTTAAGDVARPAVVAPPIVRVTAGTQPVTDARGVAWAPSPALVGGRVLTSSGPVAGTATPALYRSQRIGVERFSIPLPVDGTYVVDLLLDETTATAPGMRVFDVVSGDHAVVTHLDVFALAGPNRAWHVMFTVPVHDGKLDLSFVPNVGETAVSAVAVAYLSQNAPDHVAWSDEFDGPAGATPDPARWTPEVGGTGWGNKELQYFSDRVGNAQLDGEGRLALIARRERLPGTSNDYTSARLITKNSFSFQYGRVVARAMLPQGKGLWPGFWALGHDIDTVKWPRSGEIDMIESNGTPDFVLGSLHGFQPGAPNSSFGASATHRGATPGQFHDYAALWSPLGVQFSVDDTAYYVAAPEDLPANAVWSFDKPFYLLLTLSVGGTFPGSPDSSTTFPATFLLDSIRVYR